MSNTDLFAAFPFAFPVFFVAMWLAVTTILSIASGWRRLAARFPNRPDAKVLESFSFCSGMMGWGVHYGSCLTLQVCEQGLRVSVWKILGPFDRPFLVPWRDLGLERRRLLTTREGLRHGAQAGVGFLEVSVGLARRISEAAGARWPVQLGDG